MKIDKHCVFINTDLRYDGRVSAVIKTLAHAFPEDVVYIYNLKCGNVNITLPPNVQYCRCRSLFTHFSHRHIFQILRALEFAIFSFFKLLFFKPKTVQIHHEVVVFGPLLYKLLRRKCFYLYDDKELYVPKNKNIPFFLFFIEKAIIKWADLVVYTNEYRRKAIYYLFKPKNKHIIVENFVFEPQHNVLDESIILLLDAVKEKKIVLHQGVIDKARGLNKILTVLEYLPHDWIMVFIGVSVEEFRLFTETVPPNYHSMVKHFGFIPYSQLNTFWKHVDASIMFYNDDTFNNKYAAPNRLYSAANNGVPLIVNRENITLRMFVEIYKSGISFPPKKNVAAFFQDFDFFHSNAKLYTGKFEYSDGYIPQLMQVYKLLES